MGLDIEGAIDNIKGMVGGEDDKKDSKKSGAGKVANEIVDKVKEEAGKQFEKIKDDAVNAGMDKIKDMLGGKK